MSATRLTRVGLATAVALVSFGAAALIGEAAVRYRERHRTDLTGTMPLLFYPHGGGLGHALVRNFDYFGWIHIDRAGFRGPEVTVGKPPGELRIMAIGSSTTFDPAVSGDQAAWPARLQFRLHELAPNQPVEVINAGVPGYRVIHDVIRLETDLFRYQPDVIILYEGHNDLSWGLRKGREQGTDATDTPGEVRVVTPWGHWLSRHSLLYGKLVGRLLAFRYASAGRRALHEAQAGGPSPEEIIESGAQEFERDLTFFLMVARSLGARVVIPAMVHVSGVGTEEERDSTLFHEWSYSVPFASPEAVLRGYVRYNAVLREVAGRFSATWVPTDSFGLAGPAWYARGDPIHFNDHGADRMARHLAQALVASGALKLHKVPPGATPRAAMAGR